MTDPTTPSKRILSPVSKYAEACGTSKHTIYRSVAAGILKAIRLTPNGQLFIVHDSFDPDGEAA
jgi:hypothetical protein